MKVLFFFFHSGERFKSCIFDLLIISWVLPLLSSGWSLQARWVGSFLAMKLITCAEGRLAFGGEKKGFLHSDPCGMFLSKLPGICEWGTFSFAHLLLNGISLRAEGFNNLVNHCSA